MKRWPEHVRSRALALYAELGGPEASAQTGVPRATIRQWAKRQTARAELVLANAPASSGPVVPWRQRRDSLVADLGAAVVETLDATRRAVQDGRLRDARDGSVALGVLIDKAQLLSGDVTSRSEQYRWHEQRDATVIEAEIETLRRELDEESG